MSATFIPFEPAVMDGEFVLADIRTREGPSALLVDVIGTPKHGGKQVKPTDTWAIRSIKNAACELTAALNDPSSLPFRLPYATLHCLFALACLKCHTPIVIIPCADRSRDVSLAAESLALALNGDMKQNLAAALLELGLVFQNGEPFTELLKGIRSKVWSSYVPGYIAYIDVCVEGTP